MIGPVIEEARCLGTTTPAKRSQREGEGHTSEQYESRDMVARPRYLDTRQPWARLENLKLNNQPMWRLIGVGLLLFGGQRFRSATFGCTINQPAQTAEILKRLTKKFDVNIQPPPPGSTAIWGVSSGTYTKKSGIKKRRLKIDR